MNSHDHYIQLAATLANQLKHRYVTTEHLLLALLTDEAVLEYCALNQLNLEALRLELTTFVEEYTAKFGYGDSQSLSATATNSVGRAKRNAITLFYDKCSAMSLFFGILNEGTCWASYLIKKHGKNVCLPRPEQQHRTVRMSRISGPRMAFARS